MGRCCDNQFLMDFLFRNWVIHASYVRKQIHYKNSYPHTLLLKETIPELASPDGTNCK